MNKGKRSVPVDLRSARGRELLTDLITAPGADAGIVPHQLPGAGWLDYERLAERRPDLVMVNIVGNHDGSSAVDYTVNPATGFPWATGPAAPRRCRSTTCCRRGTRSPARWRPPGCWPPSGTAARTGEGQLVRLALSDVAFAMVGNLGKIAEVQVSRASGRKDGNYLYGAFGRDFATKEGRRIMIVALTRPPVAEPGGGDRSCTRRSTPRSRSCWTSTCRRRATGSPPAR